MSHLRVHGTLIASNDDLGYEDFRCSGIYWSGIGPFYIEVRAGASQSTPTKVPAYLLVLGF